MADKNKLIVDTLRDKKLPSTRGYQLYRTEAEINGEKVKTYEEWLKTSTQPKK
jgi:hypothetical protein